MFLILNLQDVDLTVRLCLLELILLSEITLLPRIPINIVLFVVKSLYKVLHNSDIGTSLYTFTQTDRQTREDNQTGQREGAVCLLVNQQTGGRV